MKRIFRQFTKKAFASLLIAAMLLGDASVITMAEPVDETDQGDTRTEQYVETPVQEEEEVQEVSDEPETEVEPEETEVREVGDEPDTEIEPEGEAQESEPDEGRYIEVEGESYTMETSEGAPGSMRSARFQSFSNNSRGDYFHEFYNQLSVDEKSIYNFLTEHADDYITHSYDSEGLECIVYDGEYVTPEAASEIFSDSFESMKNAWGAFALDNPEVFWLDVDKIKFTAMYSGHETSSGTFYNVVKIKMTGKGGTNNYRMIRDRYCKGSVDAARSSVDADKKRIQSAVDAIVKSSEFVSSSSITEKAGIINDTLTNNNYYNRHVKYAGDDSNDFAHIAVSALISDASQLSWLTSSGDLGDSNAPVCEGYAMAFKAVCKQAGIPCVVVLGQNHAWNYVQTEDGVWYAVDTTWNDPIRSDEYKKKETPSNLIRKYFMVGSETVCSGNDKFTNGHQANSSYIKYAKVPTWPVISEYAAPETLFGPVLSVIEGSSPEASDGVITAGFNTDKAGEFYWVVREVGDDEPDVYEIQDGRETVENGSGHGSVTDEMISSGEPVSFDTYEIPTGNYDLYIVQLTPEEYVSNVIKYSNIRVVNELTGVTIRAIKDSKSNISGDDTLYIGQTYTVVCDVEPEELADLVTIDVVSSNESVMGVDDDNMLRPFLLGQTDVTVTAKHVVGGTVRSTVTSDPVTVTIQYPKNTIFEDNGKRFSTDGTTLYEGWLTEINGKYRLEKVDGNYPVYYFRPENEFHRSGAVMGEQVIDGRTYLFGQDCRLIREWIKLDSIAIDPIPADANQSGAIDTDTLSYGASCLVTAKITPNIANDSLDAEWTTEPASYIKVTPVGGKGDELYAKIDVLKKTDDPDTPIKVTVKAGEDINRKSATINVYTRYPVGWHRIGGKTYYGVVRELTDEEKENDTDNIKRNRVEHALGKQKIGSREYYFMPSGEDAGAMATGGVIIDGVLHVYGDDGVLIGIAPKKGFVEISGSTYYYDSGEKVTNAIVADEYGNHYYMGDDGALVSDGWVEYTPTGSSSSYILYSGHDGVLTDGVSIIEGKPYLFISRTDGEHTYPCTLAKGKTVYDGKAYYAHEGDTPAECYLLSGYFWAEEGGSRKYYYALLPDDKDAYCLQSGWDLVGGVWRHFEENEGASKYEEISSSASNGWIQRNDTGKRYYRKSNGKLLTGWQTIDGCKYYFDSDGSVATGLWTIGNNYYYFGENCRWDYDTCMPEDGDDYGIMKTGRITYTLGGEEHTNFFNASGIRQSGWQLYTDPVTGKEMWDYYDAIHPDMPDSFAATPISGMNGWYRIVRDGIEARYCFIGNKSPAKGWQTVDGKKYYFDTAADVFGAAGRMAAGIITTGSNRYYLRENEAEGRGTLLTGRATAKDKDGNVHEYYADENGVLRLGWQKVDGEWNFYDYERGYRIADAVSVGSGWVVIPETEAGVTHYYKYYFKNGNTPVTGMQTIDGKMYFFGNIKNDVNYGRLLTGLIKSGHSYYYGTTYDDEAGAESSSAGELKRGLFTVSESGENVTRYANDKGVIQTGWVTVDSSLRYFLSEKDVTDNGYDINVLGKRIRVERVADTFLNCEWYKGLEAPFDGDCFCFRNGTTLLKGWQSVNGYKYYFDPVTGRQWTGPCLIGNKWYDLGAPATDGYMCNSMKTGWSAGSAAASDYYYDNSGARVSGWTTVDGKKYYFEKTVATDPGYGFKKHAGLFVDGKNTYVLDDTGAMLTGYDTYGGKAYYANSSGVLQYGWQMIDGVPHYFATQSEADSGAECRITTGDDNFVKVGDSWYYLKSGAKPATGFVTVAGGRYYFDNTGVMQTGWFTVGGKRYYGYTDGAVASKPGKGLHVGELAKGYCTELSGAGDSAYYFDGSNVATGGLILVDGSYRYFNSSDELPGGFGAERPLTVYGKPAGFYKTDDGSIIYIQGGKLQTGWKTVEGKKYYFDKSGILMTGEFVIGKDTYRTYSAEDDAVKADPAYLGSVFSGSYGSCYYDNNGKRLTGWVKTGNDNYYYDPESGRLKTGRFAVGNYMYFADAKGRRLTGFVRYNGDIYYCDNSGIARSGWQNIKVDGANRKFYFDTNGIMLTGLRKIGSSYYYLSAENGILFGAMMTGLFTVNDGAHEVTYYANSSGVLQSGVFVIDGSQWYFANEYDHDTYGAPIMASCDIRPYMSGGMIRTDWYTVRFSDKAQSVINKDYILINAAGGKSIKKSWQTLPGLDGVKHKYYFDTNNGAMRTGYVTVSGKEYRLGDDVTDPATLGVFDAGSMTGFSPISGETGKYRYIDKSGVSVTGWIKEDTGTYYLYLDGSCANGLTQIGNDWYYFGESNDSGPGRMLTDGDATVGSAKYTFGADGKRKTGWVTRGGRKRYYAPELVTAAGTSRAFDGKTSTVYIAMIGKDLYRLKSDGSAYGQASIPNTTKGYDPQTGIYTDANSKIITGWQTIKINNDSCRMYFMPETGMCATNTDNPVTVGTAGFLFDDHGVVITGGYKPVGGAWYYLASDGKILTGWQKVGTGQKYFDPGTGQEVGSTYIETGKNEGWQIQTIDGKPVRYYMKNGKPVTGWQTVPGAYSDQKMRFYFNPDGTLAYTTNETGELSVGNVIYRTVRYDGTADKDFGQVMTGFYGTHGMFRYTDDNGKAVTGWLIYNNNKYYLNENGFLCAGVTDVGGKKYYFSDFSAESDRNPVSNPAYGTLQYGEIDSQRPDAKYMANVSTGVLTTGWVVVNGELRCYSSDIETYGQRQAVTPKAVASDGTGWYAMGGNDYYVSISRGVATVKKGFFRQTIAGVTPARTELFCLDPTTGELLKNEGLFAVGNSRYYGYKDESMPAGYPRYIVKTGTFSVGTDSYFTDANGVIRTGLQNNKFYSPEDGKLFTEGFFTYNNNVYYAYENGDLAKGTVTLTVVEGVEEKSYGYYFDNNGIRKSGWFSFKDDTDNKTYKYYYDTNGRLLKDGRWIIAGKEYLFDGNGRLQTGVIDYKGDSYYADPNGVILKGWNLVTNPVTKAKKWRYYAHSDGKEIIPIYAPGDNPGNYWGIIREGADISVYYISRNTTVCRNGWTTIDNRQYYFDADGRLDASGSATATLIAGADGSATAVPIPVSVKSVGADRFAVKPKNDTVLAAYTGSGDFGGYAVSGFIKDNAGKLYYANDKGKYMCGSITVKRGDASIKYYADDSYRLLTGPSYIGDKKYLFDDEDHLGRLLSSDLANPDGTVSYKGDRYYTDRNGVIQTGWQYVKNNEGEPKYRYFDTVTGIEINAATTGMTGWVTLANNDTYYIKPSFIKPKITKGFAEIDGDKYYFDTDTGILKKAPDKEENVNEYIRFTIGNDTYEADENGKLTVGWGYIRSDSTVREDSANENTTADYFYDKNARMVRGFYTVSGSGSGVYHFDENGCMDVGVSRIDGKMYVLGKNTGDVESSEALSYDRGKLYIDYYGPLDDHEDDVFASDSDGVLRTGWQFLATGAETAWHYFDPQSGKEYSLAEPEQSSGAYTWRVVNDSKGRAKFCFKGEKVLTGWQTLDGRKYYFGTDGRMAVGAVSINGVTYYFNDTGNGLDEGMLMTSGIINVGGRRYFMTSAGAFNTGWFTVNKEKYYADPVTRELAVGFRRIEGNTYYFSENESTIGQLQTGFFRLPDLKQAYYDREPGASNLYYADANGAVTESGWKAIVKDPRDQFSQQWSYLMAPNRPCIDMGEYILTGEIAIGDVLVDDNGNVRAYLDDGQGTCDGFEYDIACTRFDENGNTSSGTVSDTDIGYYYRFDPVTGARRKEVLYFYGNYYGMKIDDNQKNTIATMRRYINTDKEYATESDDFILVNSPDAKQLKDKGLTSYNDKTFPMCASSKVADEKKAYKSTSDIAKYSGGRVVPGTDGHVDVYDVELYSKDVYDLAIEKYGPNNLVLMGASSGAGICLGLYAYAIERAMDENDDNLLPAQVVLLCPWLDVSMSNPSCRTISTSDSGPTDVETLRYWGARYTRDAAYKDAEGHMDYKNIPGPGVEYSFANSLKLEEDMIKNMSNIYMYTGSYDPCSFDCILFVNMARSYGAGNVQIRNYGGEPHGFMFFSKGVNALNVTVDACRKVMTQ